MQKSSKISMLCFVLAGFMLFNCSGDSSSSLGTKGKKAKAAGLTSDGHDLLVWDDGALDAVLLKIDTIQITDSNFDGIAYFKGLNEGEIPEKGDIIASNITKNAPEGFLYKVAEVSLNGDTAAVRIGYASIEDAVEEAEVQQTIELGFDEEGTLQKVLQKSVSKTFNPSIPTFKYDNYGTVKTNVSYTITLNVDITIKKFSLKYAKMSVSQAKSLSQEIDLQGKISAEKKFDLASINLSTIDFWIGPVPVVITPKLIAQGKISANAEFKVNSKFEINDASEYGFKYEGGSFHIISESNTKTDFDFEHSISGDIRFGILVGLELKLYGVLGFHVMAGPSLKLSASTNGFFPGNSFDFKNKNQKARLDLGTDMDLGVTMKFNVLFKTIKLLDKSYGGFSFIKNLKESNMLPSFDKLIPSINETFNGLAFNSVMQKPELGFAVNDYGICLEEAGSNKCVNGAGIRKAFGAVKDANARSIPVVFENLKPGAYNVYPYFQSSMGTYYDKATSAGIPDPKNIPDVRKEMEEKYRNASCKPDSSNFSNLYDTRDNKMYRAVEIGTQIWMAENLTYDANGSECFYKNTDDCIKYGKYYDWETAMNIDTRCNSANCGYRGQKKHNGICPLGWHIPDSYEWAELANYAGGVKYLRANEGWLDRPDSKDCYGFNALNIIEEPSWWTSDIDGQLSLLDPIENGYAVYSFNVLIASVSSDPINKNGSKKTYRYIRCVKD